MQHYSPLDQINSKNVKDLGFAWEYDARSIIGNVPRGLEATPIVANGVMYLPTPYSTVVALEPETGKELWVYKMEHGRPAGRGVAYWPGNAKTPASILFGTSDGRLVSLNAQTGKLTAGFGENGSIDIKTDIQNGIPNAQFNVTSPVTIYRDLVIAGGQVQESPAADQRR